MKTTDLISEINVLLRDKRFTAALQACDNALSAKMPKTERITLLVLKAKVLTSQNASWSGPGLSILKEALELCSRGSEDHLKVLSGLTAAYAGVQSLAFCKQFHDEFQALYQPGVSPHLDLLWAKCEYNLGLCYHQVEYLEMAAEQYLMARTAYRQVDDSVAGPFLNLIKVNMIDIFQETDEHYVANCLMEEVFPALSEDEWGAIIRLRRGVHAFSLGDSSAALLWIESGLGHRSCDIKTRGRCYSLRHRSCGHWGARLRPTILAWRLCAWQLSQRTAISVSGLPGS